MNCEFCFSPSIDDFHKVIYQGKVYCCHSCFTQGTGMGVLNSEPYLSLVEEKEELQRDFNDFKKQHDELSTYHLTFSRELDKVLNSFDDKFEEGNTDLDNLLIALTELTDI